MPTTNKTKFMFIAYNGYSNIYFTVKALKHVSFFVLTKQLLTFKVC